MSDLRSNIVGKSAPTFPNAACRPGGRVDRTIVELFAATPKRTADELAMMRAICESCPHIEPCREWALDNPRPAWPGYYGGLNLGEQRAIRRNRKLARKEPDHGTEAGYRQHRRLGTEACDQCRQAHARAFAEYTDRKRLER